MEIQFAFPSVLYIAKAGELFAVTVQEPDLETAPVKQQYVFWAQTQISGKSGPCRPPNPGCDQAKG